MAVETVDWLVVLRADAMADLTVVAMDSEEVDTWVLYWAALTGGR